MKTDHCLKCPKYHCCKKICRLVYIDLMRLEHGDKRLKKNKHRPKLRFEAEMDRIEYIVFKNKVYGAFDGD